MTPPDVPPPAGRLAAWAFGRYVRGLAGKHFSTIWWNAEAAAGPPRHPVLFVANHTNWWDGFLAYLVGARLGLHFQVLMDAENLDHYWMFKWIGALPLHLGSPRHAHQDLRAAALHLRRPATGVWIFPQGARRPPAEALTRTQRGAAELALAAGQAVTLWPVAFRYAHLREQLPEAFVWLGNPWQAAPAQSRGAAPRRELAAEIERRLQSTVDALDARLRVEDLGPFTALQPGRLSINKRLDRVRHFAGTVPGPFEPRNG